MGDRKALIRRQVLVGLKLYGDAIALARSGRCDPQNATTATDGHTFPKSDFGWHRKYEFDNCAFRDCRFRVKEDTSSAQILRESRNRSTVKLNGQWQQHFKPLRTATFQTI
ncbi:MAG: hypothetical protein WB817_03730 [Terriglobales bacterium]